MSAAPALVVERFYGASCTDGHVGQHKGGRRGVLADGHTDLNEL